MLRPRRIALFVFLGAAAAALFALAGRREATPAPDAAPAPEIERRAARPNAMPAAPGAATPGSAPPSASTVRDDASPQTDQRDVDPPIDPADTPFVEAHGEPTPELVRAAIEAVVADLVVDRALSPAELDRAAEALVALRAARAELDQLPMEPAHAERRRALVEALGQASETFRAITQMSPAEFTTRAAEVASSPAARGEGSGPGGDRGGGGGGGIDRGVDPDYVPADDFLPPRGPAPEMP